MLVAVQLSVLGLYLPPVFRNCRCRQLRPRRSFRCRSTLPCDSIGLSGALVVLVAVQLSVLGLYLPPVFKWSADYRSTPDDHFTAGPHCRVTASGIGRVGGAGGCPTVGAGIVSPAGVQNRRRHHSAPDDHFAAGPHCRVTLSGRGRVGGAGGCPTIGAGIVSPAGVQIRPASYPPQTIISLPVQTAV